MAKNKRRNHMRKPLMLLVFLVSVLFMSCEYGYLGSGNVPISYTEYVDATHFNIYYIGELPYHTSIEEELKITVNDHDQSYNLIDHSYKTKKGRSYLYCTLNKPLASGDKVQLKIIPEGSSGYFEVPSMEVSYATL
jgi:hypothetical protein